jgi:hypothetical protein
MAELTEAEKRVIAYTLLGEAAGEGKEGMEAVMWTIMNRANSGRYPSNPALVATQKNSKGVHQYSTWNKKTLGGNSPEDRFSPNSPVFKEALAVVQRVMAGEGKDPTGGATHFYAEGSAKPSWFEAEGPAGEIKIGNHRFAARNTVADATRATDAAELLATGRIQQRPQAYAAEPEATPSSGLTTRTVTTIDASSLPGYESLRSTVPAVSVLSERNRLNSIRSNPANAQDLVGAAARQPTVNNASANKVSRGAPQDLTGPAARATPQNAAASAKTDRARTTVPANTPARPAAVQAQNKTVEQIGREADNARLSGYRDIQEMGPSSQGAKPTPQTTTVRPQSGATKTAGTVGDKSGPQPLAGTTAMPRDVRPQVTIPEAPKPKPVTRFTEPLTKEQVQKATPFNLPSGAKRLQDDPSKPRLVAEDNGFVKPIPRGAPGYQIANLAKTINRMGERYGGIREKAPTEQELAATLKDDPKKKVVVDPRKEVIKRGAPVRGAATVARPAQPTLTPTQQLLQQMRGNANYLPGQIAAIERNAGFYSPSPGTYMPTMAPGGVPRNTYGDVSPSEYAAQEERKNNQSKTSGASSWQWW